MDQEAEIYNFKDPLNLLVGFLISTIGAFGIICNSLMIYVFLKERSEKTAFNLICFFRAISNVTILTMLFMLNLLPKTILGHSLYPPVIESWCIIMASTLYLGNEYQIVLIALNRFCAMFFPFKYTRIFAIPQTTAVLVMIYVYRIIKRTSEWIPQSAKECHALYSTYSLTWSYSTAPECSDWEDDALVVILYTFIAMCIVNLITFVKIMMFYRKKNENRDKETVKRMRKNTIHFVHTILQDSLYLIDLTFTFKLNSLSDHRVWTFISGTLIWECLHSIDGFIMVMFNERLSFFKKKPKNSSMAIPIVPANTHFMRRGTVTTITLPPAERI